MLERRLRRHRARRAASSVIAPLPSEIAGRRSARQGRGSRFEFNRQPLPRALRALIDALNSSALRSTSSGSRRMEIAFSTARRARVSRRSSTGSSVPPASIDSRRRTIARSASSSAITSRRLRMSSNSPATANASSTSSIGWRTSTPAAARCNAQPGLALATTRRAAAGDRRPASARGSPPPCSGCSAEYAPPAPQQGPRRRARRRRRTARARCAPAGGPAARGAGGTDPARRPRTASGRGRGSAIERGAEPLVDVADTRRERARRRRCRAGGRSPSAPRRTRRSRRGSARRRASTPSRVRRARRRRREPGVDVQRAAAVAALARAARRRRRPRPRTRIAAACTARCQASITQPVKSHTSLPVALERRLRRSGRRAAGRARFGTRSGPLGRGERAVEPASSSRWWPSGCDSRAAATTA